MIAVTIPSAWFISANDRLHWAEKARRTRAIRLATRAAATGHQPFATPCLVTVTIHRPRGGRMRDAENGAPTGKACVDGLRDAGILPDDDQRHVVAVIPRIHLTNRQDGTYLLEIDHVHQEVPW